MGASNLTDISALANWDTSNVTGTEAVFGDATDETDMEWIFNGATSLAVASFANAKGFTNEDDALDLTASQAWSRITIGKDAKPNLKLPDSITWMNQTRGDNKQVSSADMAAQIKAGNGEGVWVPFKAPVAVTSVSVSGASSLEVGDTAQLTATVLPDDASNKGVTWESSDTSVVTVDADGKVTAVKAGTVTITATAQDGSGKSGSLELTVKAVTTTPADKPTGGAGSSTSLSATGASVGIAGLFALTFIGVSLLLRRKFHQ